MHVFVFIINVYYTVHYGLLLIKMYRMYLWHIKKSLDVKLARNRCKIDNFDGYLRYDCIFGRVFLHLTKKHPDVFLPVAGTPCTPSY